MVVATKSAAKRVTDRSPRPPRSDPNGDGKTKAKTKAVKIAANTHALLAKLSADQERPMGDVVAELIENERRRLFMVAANEDYARLRADPEAWADWQAEIKSMEGTLMDGLDEYSWEECVRYPRGVKSGRQTSIRCGATSNVEAAQPSSFLRTF